MKDEERDDAADQPEPTRPAAPLPGRAARGPGEGPAGDGGSGLAARDEPAEEEVGGGD